MTCKCGHAMWQENLSPLPADYHWYWICPLRRWFNFWKHTKATEVNRGVQVRQA